MKEWDGKTERRKRDFKRDEEIIDFVSTFMQEQNKEIKELIRVTSQIDNKTTILLERADKHDLLDDSRFEKVDKRIGFLEKGYWIWIGMVGAVEAFFKLHK